ncbi:GTP-Gsp1p interacting protein [Komagataella phaffii CBS 7435]|uniref:Uncharacterized protein n=2 Tax=Komagataella phaffii TaxID=460519 RepID=C4R5S3_KOMPG|nr:uncharacterized protein PAS_chr3_1228 [Komagataella phaffii GS115]AOA63480.1 GQ67_03969T0 [Komagataella phaffii]CAH2449280.1 GTP-Gsp1p interacting protein [Komagataella phaffii CBS 7435]AOA68852.1 GQ68_03942T0 [Komagataella phaffii GS115]CAY70909.1 hypothetical protein PAS_chr3_1228 [Komagataella phaffii GS115]CCA39293.1 GTP-Gsp1p interacting protein [Komagataella phaffii CBS 7435]
MEYSLRKLYGGAITIQLPTTLLDASKFREVPDSQEVFVNGGTNTTNYQELNKNDSIIIDLLERAEEDIDVALKTHIQDISEANGVGANWFLAFSETVPDAKKIAIVLEEAKKWGKDSKGDVLVMVIGLIRLKEVSTDVVITANVPIGDDEKEVEGLHKLVEHRYHHADDDNLAFQRIKIAEAVVLKILETFHVDNWGLFG